MTRTTNATIACPACDQPAIVEVDYASRFWTVKIKATRFVCIDGCQPRGRRLDGLARSLTLYG